jgi:hypothetical protein
MKIMFWAFIIALAFLYTDHKVDKAHAEGFSVGMRYALKSNPPSEELEMTCAGLWVGEQSKKYFEKERRSAR